MSKRHRRLSAAARRRRNQNRWGALILGLCVVMCAVTMGVYRDTASHRVVLDADSLCPASGPREVTVEQAGDNVYYLGFLFTLTSLLWALYRF